MSGSASNEADVPSQPAYSFQLPTLEGTLVQCSRAQASLLNLHPCWKEGIGVCDLYSCHTPQNDWPGMHQ